jgi:dCTP deaminase
MPPHSFYLARTIEYFKIPDDVFGECLGKSTFARGAIIVNVTPLEPGWEGHVTLELSNTADVPSVVYVGEGICQFVFFRGERPAVSYGDRNGKYMKQVGVTLARV